MYRTAIALLALTSVAAAQTVHQVDVGSSGLTFVPSTVNALAGDMIVFNVHTTHDVVQSSFAAPCTPMSGGISSGFFTASPTPFTLTVSTIDPLYFFCSTPSHCQAGMVFSVNSANATAFAAAARTAVAGTGSVSQQLTASGLVASTGAPPSSGAMTSMMSSTSGGSSMATTGSMTAASSGGASSVVGGATSTATGVTPPSTNAPAATTGAAVTTKAQSGFAAALAAAVFYFL